MTECYDQKVAIAHILGYIEGKLQSRHMEPTYFLYGIMLELYDASGLEMPKNIKEMFDEKQKKS